MSVDFVRRWILLHISTRINISLISDFFIKLMKLPMSFFDTKLMGDLIQRIEDHRRIERFLTVQSLNVLFLLFNLGIFSLVLIIYSIKIFIVFLIGSIIYTAWILLFLKKRKRLDYQKFEQYSRNSSRTYQLITGMQEIKLQNCERRKRWEWEDVQANLYKVNLASLSLEQYQEAGSISINELKNVTITILAATSVITGELTLGMMLSIQFIIGQLNSPLEQIAKFAYNFQDMKISIKRINDIHEKDDEGSISIPTLNLENLFDSDIYIRNLSFQYDGESFEKVLDNINLVIPSGKVTAIVGTSGSGKTTLIKLLLKYYNVTDGSIYIGDQNLNSIHPTTWRNHCGAVMQDGYIFSDSIARNIAVSDDIINVEKLLFAAKTANIHDFVKKLPLKYNTKIGNDGQVISQGQKQRILIARAIYKDPNFLFFDEATNALDTNNEKLINENLEKLYKGKTVVIVAHRLSTVKNADQIIVLMNGRIVENGNHQNLILKKGEYYKLVKNQLELGT
jgi:ATP-binding cassette subfamily B protein